MGPTFSTSFVGVHGQAMIYYDLLFGSAAGLSKFEITSFWTVRLQILLSK